MSDSMEYCSVMDMKAARRWRPGHCSSALFAAMLLACSAPTREGNTNSGSGGQTPIGEAGGMGGRTMALGGSPSTSTGGALASGGATGGTSASGSSSGGSNASGGASSSGGQATSGASATAGTASGGSAGAATGGVAGAVSGGVAGTTNGGVAGAASGGVAGAATGGVAGAANGGSAGSGGVAGGASGAGGSAGTDAGKLVLFDGKNLSAWQHTDGSAVRWRLLTEESAMEVVPGTGNIITKQKFGSMFLHIEYWTPALPASVTGQSRGNSGIYVKRAYEFQVLDSFGQPISDDTCGAIYKTSKPLVSACYGAEMWNTYEIEFKDSTWSGNTKTMPAVAVSVHLNGQLVQENVRLTVDPTTSGIADAPGPQPLMLQDHDANGRVRYRNIWVIPR
ncbi:MAG TPA: DUF1080 domain-containing protein [Polyangiaceae bacterium]|jgi:hypothetical protein|nr:DUF1080 domain-containing protein [Polyangiaceae bacterium]